MIARPAIQMESSIASVPAKRPHGGAVAVRRHDRAHVRASWATSRTPSRALAAHWGVSESRARHLRTDDTSGPVTTLLAMIADPAVDAGPVVAAVLQAWEERFLFAPTPVLRKRLAQLKDDDEHRLEAAQNRASQTNDPRRCDAYRDHAAALLEMSTIEEVLGA